MTEIQIIIAILTASLISLGLGALLRPPRKGATEGAQQGTAPDTTIQEIDDAITHDAPHTPRPDPSAFPGDDPDTVVEVGKWTDEL